MLIRSFGLGGTLGAVRPTTRGRFGQIGGAQAPLAPREKNANRKLAKRLQIRAVWRSLAPVPVPSPSPHLLTDPLEHRGEPVINQRAEEWMSGEPLPADRRTGEPAEESCRLAGVSQRVDVALP